MGHSEPVFAQLRNLSALVVMNPSFIMPSIAIILPFNAAMSEGGRGPPTRAWGRLFPVECALLPLVDEADRKDAEEDHYRPESDQAYRAVGNGPREQKGDFQIEHDEQDGDQVVAHVELHACIAEGFETALVRRQLFIVGAVRAQEAP